MDDSDVLRRLSDLTGEPRIPRVYEKVTNRRRSRRE